MFIILESIRTTLLQVTNAQCKHKRIQLLVQLSLLHNLPLLLLGRSTKPLFGVPDFLIFARNSLLAVGSVGEGACNGD